MLLKKSFSPLVTVLFFMLFVSCAEKKETVENKPETLQILTPQPINGQYRGVIELGGSGFNSFIINIDSLGSWFLEKAEFGVSQVYENQVTEDSIRIGLERYFAAMLEYDVPLEGIHFIMSSTAVKNEKVIAISAVLSEMGYEVNSVDARMEGVYGLMATLPKKYENEAFVVDVGSGNTKISWIENNEIKSLETYGSKYYLDSISDKVVYDEILSLTSQVPAAQSKICFLIGGVPYKMSRETAKEDERYTPLLKASEYHFNDPKMKSGLNIYKAIMDGTKCQNPVFDVDCNFSIGFLIDKMTSQPTE